MNEDRIYHVYPLNDRKEYTTGLTEYCACKPVVERRGREVHVHHNSYDGREFFENDNPSIQVLH